MRRPLAKPLVSLKARLSRVFPRLLLEVARHVSGKDTGFRHSETGHSLAPWYLSRSLRHLPLLPPGLGDKAPIMMLLDLKAVLLKVRPTTCCGGTGLTAPQSPALSVLFFIPYSQADSHSHPPPASSLHCGWT